MDDLRGQAADPYANWSGYLRDQDAARARAGLEWEPLLVHPLSAAFFKVVERAEHLLIDPDEVAFAQRVRKSLGVLPPVFVYRKRGSDDPNGDCEVLAEGLPMEAAEDAPEAASRDSGGDETSAPRLLAIIDDGIGFLNERFQAQRPAGLETRMRGLWIQSIRLNPTPGGVLFGRALSRADIQGWVTRPDELTVYKTLNDTIFAEDTVRTSEQAASHGTHLMDLAGGADAYGTGDPMRDVPLLAVQLPPQIVDDTSGTWMVPFVLQGMHWILLKALQEGVGHVVINLSFGITAGPKDGSGLFPTHVSYLIHLAGLLGVTLDVVVPFGNDFENRQVAGVVAEPAEETRLDIRLPSDDRAPSYVELRPDGDASDLGLGFVAPDDVLIPAQSLAPGAQQPIWHRGHVVGRIYHTAASGAQAAYLTVAFAPTAPVLDDTLAVNGQGPLIEAGVWRLILINQTTAPMPVRLEIQRGDTMPGYRLRGRQARFDDADGYDYDMGPPPPGGVVNPVETKDYARLGAAAYVTHQGTNSAFTVVPGAPGRFHTVGGAFLRRIDPSVPPAVQDPAVAAAYTAYNTRPGQGTPTAGARSSHNHALGGLLAAGVLSGSSARYIGSSAAAAVVSRGLVLAGTPGGLEQAMAPGRLPDQVLRGTDPRD